MSDFSRDYLILVFLGGLGFLQIAASHGRLRGLLLIPNLVVSRLLGVSLVISTIVWFFASGPRNISDKDGGLDGNTQALLFAVGSLAAVIVTLLGSSVVNVRMRSRSSNSSGLESLKETTYIQALFDSLSYWWSKWR